MFVATDLSKLPLAYHGLEFLVDWASVPGFRPKSDLAMQECDRIFTIDTMSSFGHDALISGHTIVRDKASGGLVSVLRADLPVLVDVYAEPEGIFVGNLCVALARDLSDEHRRWHYWKFNAGELLHQALAVCA